MGRMIVKGKEFAAARVLCGDSAPENYAASELRKYLAMLGIPEGDGAAVSIREDASVGRDGYAVTAGENGEITGYRMRCEKSKLTTVRALQSMGFETIAAGDSFNDLAMIQASKAGFLFKSTEQIKKDYPQIPAFEEFGDLLEAIRNAMD